MACLSDHLDAHKRTHTHGLTAVAADIRGGKTAFANGVKLVGSADLKPISRETNNTILLVQNPTGLVSSSYNPVTASNGAVLVQDESIIGLAGGVLNIETNGYFYSNTAISYQSFVQYASANRPVGYARKYEVWGKTKNATLTTNDGIRFWFNFDLAAQTTGWIAELYYTGSAFRVDLTEWNNPTSTNRLASTFSSVIAVPLIWHMAIYEIGDRVLLHVNLYESDLITDAGSYFGTYNLASRPHQNHKGMLLGARLTPGDEWLIRGLSIMDIPSA